MSTLIDGFVTILTPENLLWLTVGVAMGMIVGVLPGLGSMSGMVLLFPIAFTLDPIPAIAMLAAVYYGVMYGGTIGAILVNMPGSDACVATTFDGYPLARQGRAGPALVIAAVGSFVGGTIGLVILTIAAPAFSGLATSLGPMEYFILIVMALLAIALIVADDVPRGLASALLGVAVATVGIDVVSGQPRFTFGSPELMSGVSFVHITIGLFAIGEILDGLYEGRHITSQRSELVRIQSFWPSRSEWRQSTGATMRGSFLGFGIGTLPGAGGTIASLAAYVFEKSVAKDRRRFGKGAIEGVAAPESANNAATSGAMVPMLTLGIPSSAPTAVLLAAAVVVGLRPGAQLMADEPEFAWSFIASMYTGNVILVLLSVFAIPLFARVAMVPYGILAPVVVVIATIGAYLDGQSMFGVYVMFIAGIVGFFMKRFGFSPAATVIALVLAPIAETALRQSLIIGEGSWTVFLERTPARILLVLLAILVLARPASRLVSRVLRQRRGEPSVETDTVQPPEKVDS